MALSVNGKVISGDHTLGCGKKDEEVLCCHLHVRAYAFMRGLALQGHQYEEKLTDSQTEANIRANKYTQRSASIWLCCQRQLPSGSLTFKEQSKEITSKTS